MEHKILALKEHLIEDKRGLVDDILLDLKTVDGSAVDGINFNCLF